MVAAGQCTIDGFLGGRVQAAQPRRGFRAGHDTVLLAAAVPAAPGEWVLELGAGAGVASLCLAARVPGCRVLGLDVDPALVALANANAARNRLTERVRFVVGNAMVPHGDEAAFDHVFFNPPFHPPSAMASPVRSRDRAMRDTTGTLCAWTECALGRLKAGGSASVIIRADRSEEVLAPAHDAAITLLPLASHGGKAPGRVVIQLRKGAGPKRTVLAPLILHQVDGRSTAAAEAVLRFAAVLDLREPGQQPS